MKRPKKNRTHQKASPPKTQSSSSKPQGGPSKGSSFSSKSQSSSPKSRDRFFGDKKAEPRKTFTAPTPDSGERPRFGKKPSASSSRTESRPESRGEARGGSRFGKNSKSSDRNSGFRGGPSRDGGGSRKGPAAGFTPRGGASKFQAPPEKNSKKTAVPQLMEGHVKRHPDGFGFLIPANPDLPDVYLPKHTMSGIMSNDVIRAKVAPEGHDRYRGEVNEVLKRAVLSLIGTYTAVTKDQGIILDKEGTWGSNVLIPPGKSKDAKDGELVHVKIQSYATWNSDLSGEVIEALGDTQDPLLDAKRVLITNQIPTEFSPETIRTAHDLPKEVLEAEKKGRKDLRGIDLITIDGATAKDFDDAVCVVSEGAGFRLWVAIADVSHYVRPGTAIDKDAYTRGTSVYFPGFVVPMLPEQLSNELCSLKPKVDRLALVCEAQISGQGDVSSAKFYEAVICSKSRVTYGEAQDVIEGNGDPKHAAVKQNILKCAELAKVLLAKRFQRGSLDLEIPETQILLDDGGHPVDIVKSERLFAHRLIEELMLVANVCVAKFLSDAEIPAIYRIHEEPFEDSLSLLNKFLTSFGANTQIEGGKVQKKINQALEAFHGKPQAEILNILTLRSMKQAKYSPTNVGHFGLGFEFYTHFTSPIRRYPDLIVHRLVKSLVLKSDKYPGMSEDTLATAGVMLSACEQKSTKAERQFNAIKKARFMKKFLGQEFDGMISSVTKFGVFVLLRQFEVDGLLKVDALGRDEFIFDENTMALVGRRSGMRYALGDAVKIQVLAVDTDLGRIDFGLAEVSKDDTVKAEGEKKTAVSPYQKKEDQQRGTHHKGKTTRPDQSGRGAPENDRRGVRKSRVSKPRRKG